MKVAKTLMIVAILGLGTFASCTPENIEDGQTEQQVERNRNRPAQNG